MVNGGDDGSKVGTLFKMLMESEQRLGFKDITFPRNGLDGQGFSQSLGP